MARSGKLPRQRVFREKQNTFNVWKQENATFGNFWSASTRYRKKLHNRLIEIRCPQTATQCRESKTRLPRCHQQSTHAKVSNPQQRTRDPRQSDIFRSSSAHAHHRWRLANGDEDTPLPPTENIPVQDAFMGSHTCRDPRHSEDEEMKTCIVSA